MVNLNSGSHLIEATPIANAAFSDGPMHLTATRVTFPLMSEDPLSGFHVHLAPSESKLLLRKTKTIHTNVLTSLIFCASAMDRSFHKVVSSHILRFAIAMRAFTYFVQSPSDDLRKPRYFNCFIFVNWVVVDSYGNVIWHVSDGREFCLFEM